MTLLEHASAFINGNGGEEATTKRAAASSSPVPAAASASRTSSLPSLRACCFLFLCFVLLRVLVGGGSYSGEGRPLGSPIGGDFEAQRHWMELTLGLPASEWYVGRHPHNDLQYWGLDYPPLTAYVSRAFGAVANSTLVGLHQLVELGASRGYESPEGKLFMRLSVLLSDVLVALPGFVLALGAINAAAATPTAAAPIVRTATQTRNTVLIYLALIHPAFILIDHGHFQYNCVSLGLVALAVYFLWVGRELVGSVCFVLSLTFKQMSLYYAPAFFVYLLARTRQGTQGHKATWTTSLYRFVLLGSVVILTLVVVFLPFLSSLSLLGQVFHRMFPFARGLYEDKVANFWCATSLVIKWHLWFERSIMVRASLLATILAFTPSCIHVWLRPSRTSFLYTLTGTSLAFFLFSFQVHEKTILLPLLPVVLLSGQHPLLNAWMGSVATFSMYPLLQKDGHALTYLALQIFFGAQALSFARSQLSAALTPATATAVGEAPFNLAARIVQTANRYPTLMFQAVQLSLFGAVLVHLAALLLPVSARYPDLTAMLFVVYAAAHFMLFHVILLLNQWALPPQTTEDHDFKTIAAAGEAKRLKAQ